MILSQQKLNKLHKFFEYFVILIPLLLISGPLLSDLAISLVALYFALIFKKNYNKEKIINFLFIYFLIFYILILTSSFLAEDKYLSLKNSLFYVRFIIFSVCFYYILQNNFKILIKLFYVLCFCFIILIFDGLFQAYFKVNIFGLPINEEYLGRRVSSFFGDELILGSYLTRMSPLLIGLGLFFFNKVKFFKYYLILLICLMEIVIFLSGERTAFILFNLTIILLTIFLNNTKKISIFVFLIIPVAITTLILMDGPSKKRIIDETIKDLKPKNYDSKFVIINRQYHEHYISSYKIFKDNIFFGVGPKNFRVVCKYKNYNLSENTCSTHSHNTYLQLLSETGLFSFLLIFNIFLIINFLLLKQFYYKLFKKTYYLNNLQVCILVHFFISLFPLTPSGSFFNNWTSIIYYFPLGILLWSFKNKEIN